MWHYCIFSRKSRVFETAPFVVIVNSKNWLQKNINSNTYFCQDQFYLFRALKMQKTSVLKKRVDFSQAISNFHFQLNSVTF